MERVKVCSSCGEAKELGLFSKAVGYAMGVRGQCKACINARMRVYNKSDAGIAAARRHREKGGKRNAEWVRAWASRQRQSLSDNYVKRRLYVQLGCESTSEIPPQLIALKREQLSLLRVMRELRAALSDEPKAPRAPKHKLTPSERKCSRCGHTKPICQFGKAKNASGHRYWCLSCAAEHARNMYPLRKEAQR